MKLIDVLKAMSSTATAKVTGWDWKHKLEICRIGDLAYFEQHPEWNDFEVDNLYALHNNICIAVILEEV